MMTQPEKIKLPPYQAYNASGADWTNSIPEHWNIRRLRNSLFRHTSGVWGADPDGINDLPCLRVADFNRNQWGIKVDNPTTRAITPLERQGKIIRAGNLLLEKSGGGDKQAVGTVVLYDHDLEATCSNFIEILVVQGNFDPRYLKFVHSTLYALGVNKRSIKQTTGIQNIDLYNYLSEKFPVPPPDEQAAIVRFLDHVDEQIQRYIAGKERLIALLEEEKQAVIHQAVTRGLDPNVRLKPSGMEWLGDVPEHWETCRLRNVVSEVTTGSRGWSSYASDSGPLFMRVANLNRGSLQLRFDDVVRLNLPDTSEVSRTRIWAGDLLVSVTAFIGSVGIASKELGEAYVSQHVARCRPHTGLSSQWLGYVLLSQVGQTHGQMSLYGGTKDGLSLDDVKNYPILLPPRAEQNDIVEYLTKTSVDNAAVIDQARRQVDLMNEYGTRLIADVVTGQLDVREAATQLQEAPSAGRRRTELRNE